MSVVHHGVLLEEIDSLTAHCLSRDDPTAERQLVRLRHDLGIALVAERSESEGDEMSPAARRMPPGTPDPFPDVVDRPPEIASGEFSAEIVRGALLHHGCLLVHEFFGADHIERLRDDIDRVVDDYGAWVERGHETVSPSWYEPFVSEQAPVPLAKRTMGGLLGTWFAADSPRGLLHLLDAFDDAGLPRVLDDYLEEPSCFALEKTALRRVPNTVPPAWHQDGFAFGADRALLNVWVALSDCGVDAPGLGVIPTRFQEIIPSRPGATIPWDLDPEEVLRIADGVPFVELTLRPGDALVFDEMLLHGTVVDPAMTKSRYCADAWFFPASDFRQEGFLPFAYTAS